MPYFRFYAKVTSYDIFLSFWLISLYMRICSCIIVAANGIISFFLWQSTFLLCICATSSYSNHLLMDGHLGCFHVLARFLLFFFLSFFFRATPMAYEGSQASGPMGTVATGLHHNHSNVGSEPHLQPTPQLTTTPYP